MNKSLRAVALISIIAFAVYAITCAALGSVGEAYGYICAIWWAVMFVMFKGGGE